MDNSLCNTIINKEYILKNAGKRLDKNHKSMVDSTIDVEYILKSAGKRLNKDDKTGITMNY